MDKHEYANIEADLLEELDQIALKYNELDSDDSLEDDDYRDIEQLVLQDSNEEGTDADTSPDDLLSSLPGFELYQSSSELVVSSCSQFLKGTNSPDRYFPSANTFDLSSGSTVEKDRDKKKVEDCIYMRVESVIEKEAENSIVVSKSEESTKSRSPSTNTTILPNSSKMEEKRMAWMEAEHIVEMNFMDSIEEIENEIAEEELFKRSRRKEHRRQREISASKERMNQARIDSAVKQLQLLTKHFLAGRRAERDERFLKGMVETIRLHNRYLLRQAIFHWCKISRFNREVVRITKWFRWHSIRKTLELEARIKGQKTALAKIISALHMKRSNKGFKVWNCFVTLLREKEAFEMKRNKNAVVLQCFLRSCLCRRKMNRLREELRKYSALEIQRLWRGNQGRIAFKEFQHSLDLKREDAALYIQKIVRSRLVRQRFHRIRVAKYEHEDIELDEMLGNEVEEMLTSMFSLENENDEAQSDWKPQIPKRPEDFQGREDFTSMEPLKCDSHDDRISDHNRSSQKHVNLMNEWKIKDEKVLESMLKRRNRMIKKNHRKKNNCGRLKDFMRNVKGRVRSRRVAP